MAAYQELFRSGELAERVRKAHSLLNNCRLCGYTCQVNRLAGILGKCGTGRQMVISSCGPHSGEEAPLVGRWGGGAIFFTNCNLKCIYCQNYAISHLTRHEVFRQSMKTPEDKQLMQEKARLYAIAQGRVQGVYFRDFTQRKAQALDLTGYVKNLSDGKSVEVLAEGERANLEQLLEHIKIGPEAARVDRVNVKWSDYSGNFNSFEMRF